ncbi:hypothetical protein LQG66_21465 [Bradyrhizobium ontarionense]|uniref:Hedgehog/Intein (Hint) domain-containing protein n=1 Tax=Bradyrhizobium ontarionense TaxID=2898149 RepID=A0ABY3R561_9BRAD|nr:hypothetical protein [Bradyrhizobium sp. A19]UFZ01882.1 hypothetical protein LQG66_21465 [Bradyrhizobium sp. A19]
MIARRLALVSFALVILFVRHASAAEQTRARQDAPIQRAVFAEGRLWLLDSGGRLSSMPEDGERIDVATPDRVIELFVQDGRAVIVTCPQETCSRWTPVERWTVRRRVGDDWETVADVATRGEQFVAATSTILLTDSRMIDLSSGGQSETALTLPSSSPMLARPKPLKEGEHFRAGGSWLMTDSGMIDLTEGRPWEAAPTSPSSTPLLARPKPLKGWPVRAVLITPKHAFVGYNGGEWGGGLQQIDRMTGIVSDIDGDLCGGNLNPACDPVNGIATIPWKPDCIAVAVGLIHMLPHGRIVEVCDNAVRLLYTHHIENRQAVFPTYTTAFFGLQRTGEDLLAVGHDGPYQVGPGDRAELIPLPEFKQANGVAVSFDFAGLVLVLTTANQRFSLSGATPMLVPR